MMRVEELDGMEAACVDVEVDIALLKVGCDCFPDTGRGIAVLDGLPGGQTQAAIVHAEVNKEEVQGVAARVFVAAHHGTAHALAVVQEVVDV